ncbi:MAG: type II secretion system protein [Minisyncoccia bacterium]|jgi:prepilin-type N-terminal cleavage/methylation domain-containing protein
MRGFTLIELLVVIAILAVLATAVVLVLNPAELLKQGRDSTRISDLSALNNAISIWTADVLNGGWPNTKVCTSTSTAPGAIGTCTSVSASTTAASNWTGIDFTRIASGSPLPRVPIDPNNGGTCKGVTTTICQYAINESTTTVGVFELSAQMESAKFYNGGSGDVTSKDGGSNPYVYEIGSNLTLW